MKGLSECEASESNVRRIQVKDIVKEVKDYLKTYSSAGMDICCPNVNRVDTMPTTTGLLNNTNTTNVAQSVANENLPQLLDSRGGSHVTNVHAFDKEDFTKGPFIHMSSFSTTENPLPKRQNQWSNVEIRLANQDKRLKSIIISCLPNDVMNYVIKCKTAKEIWNDLILAHEGPFDTRDTKIAALRLKFNAFKSLEGEKVMGTFTRLKCLLNDLENNGVTIPQAEVNATLATLYGKYNYEEGLIDQIYESETQRFSIQASSSKALISNTPFQDSDSNAEEDQRTSNEFMVDLNAEIDDLTKRKSKKGKSDKEKSEKGLIAESFDWDEESADARSSQWVDITMKKTCSKVTLDQLLSEQIPCNIVKAFGGKGRKKENNPSKEVLFTKADLTGADLSGASKSLISLSDLTANMADLTLNNAFKEIKKSSNKVSQTYVIKKRTESKHPTIQNSCPDKSALPSTEKLLLTLMKEVKGIKKQILIPSDTSSSVSQACSLKTPKQKDYLKRFVWYLDSGCSRHMIGVKQYLHIYLKEPGPKVVFGDDSSRDIEVYGSVNCNRITFTRVAYVNGLKHNLISISQLYDANFKVLFTKTQGTIFNQNNEVVLIAPRRRDVYIIDMSSFNKESNTCFLSKASPRVNWLWHKRLSHLNFKNINNLVKHNLVSELPSLTFSKDKNCLACEKEKHHKASFQTKRLFSINKSLHLLHIDLFGPVKPQTISHNKYTFVNVDEYSRSIIVKRHGKTAYDVFRGRAPNISYFYVFGCLIHIHNHRDHLGKFDEKANDGFFLGYSLVAKAFRVFNIIRQEIEETVHVTFSEDDEVISQTNTKGDAINFNENRSFPDDEFIEPRSKDTQCFINIEYFPYVFAYENTTSAVLPTLQNPVASGEPSEFIIADDLVAIHELDHAESADILESIEP
ncbi:retrovirus-related pol polyprotein from transposon TNT 1-94 [Tanacetum coccineum]